LKKLPRGAALPELPRNSRVLIVSLVFFYGMSDLSMWLALLVISGFGKFKKKIYTEVTCNLQVICARRKG
jgi:hypothetical protein